MARPEYYAEHREHVLAMEKQRYRRNRERIRQQQNEARRNWSEEVKLRVKAKDKEKRANPAYRERQRRAVKRWVARNPHRFREIQKRYQDKVKTVPSAQLNRRMSKAIRESLPNGKCGRGWRELVPYSPEELKRHLQNNFKPGMSWDRLLAGQIHIDHVIPKAKFSFTGPNDLGFKRCWALENLKPEWASVNESKNCRILEPSQIPLGL